MTNTPFLDTAPRYWAAGLPVMPLFRRDKRPIATGWDQYAETMPPPEVRDSWLAVYPEGNIGLVLGPAANLCMIDIDTEDQTVQKVITDLLPPSPWIRKGKKGMMLAYRFNGMKTFRIKDANGAMIVEGLSTRTQVVLPPSIHPETQLPYSATSDLVDVLDYLNPMPKDIESILRGALETHGIKLSVSGHTRVTDWVSRGSRDVQMVAVAGHYANGVLRGELSFKEAIARMVAWKSTCVDLIAGDDIDISKGVCRLAEFLIRDVTGPKRRALPEGWDRDLLPEERTAFGFDVFKDDHEQKTFEQLMLFISSAFEQHGPTSPARKEALDTFLAAIARSRDIDDVDVDRLLHYVIQTAQMGLKVTSLKARIKEMQQDGIRGADHNEIADEALRRLQEFGTMAFSQSQFWQWKGAHWEPMEESTLLSTIAREFGALPAAKKANDHKGILKVMQAKVARPLKLIDEPGINFANGFLNLDLRLSEAAPDFGATYTLPYRYVPEAISHMPKFDAFLRWCWGHNDDYDARVQALREAIGVTLFGIAPRFETAFCLFGQAKSGKSQLLKIIARLVPGAVTSAVPPTDWHDKFLPAQMAGKLINLCGELSERRPIDGQLFKQIISGETVTVQHKGKDPFLFNPVCAHWFATNHLPQTTDTSSGFNRRWRIFSFDRVVNDNEKILNLGDIIAAEEREAIVAWAIEAVPAALARTAFTPMPSHDAMIDEVASTNNTVRSFLKDSGRVVVGATSHQSGRPLREDDLYSAYLSFAAAAGAVRPVSLRRFRAMMRELGSEFGFTLKMGISPAGVMLCEYGSITLATPGDRMRPTGTA